MHDDFREICVTKQNAQVMGLIEDTFGNTVVHLIQEINREESTCLAPKMGLGSAHGMTCERDAAITVAPDHGNTSS
jgi:hypothetical protein